MNEIANVLNTGNEVNNVVTTVENETPTLTPKVRTVKPKVVAKKTAKKVAKKKTLPTPKVNVANTNSEVKRRGRETILINFPKKGTFTFKQMVALNGKRCKPMTVRNRIKEGLEAKEIQVVGIVKKNEVGRPCFRFQFAKAA